MNTKRIDWIDSLKFIGMFYIYLGHLGNDAGKLYLFVFSFHVPLFFFISGLVSKKTDSVYKLMSIAKKNLHSIIAPYIVFSLVGIAFLAIKNQSSAEDVRIMIGESLYGIRNNIPLGSLWFLPCLFVIILYQAILELVVKKGYIVFAIALVIYVLTPLWWDGVPKVVLNLDSALYYLVFYSLGSLISSKVMNEWINPLNKLGIFRNYIILVLSLLVMLAVYYKTTYSLLSPFEISPIQYLISFSITVTLFIPSIALAQIIQLPSILRLGKNSLLLCGTEQIIKLTTLSILSIFGLSYRIIDPMSAVIYTCMCFILSYFTALKIYTHIKKSN